MSKVLHQPHDKFFKNAMKDKRVAKQFLETHLPKELLLKINLDNIKLEQGSFIDEKYKATSADIVYSAPIDDTKIYFYILCEQQTQTDKMMPFRLTVYTVRIMELHLKQYPGEPLPIVYPLVIYSGKKEWGEPRNIFEMFGKHEDLARQFLFQPFQLMDLHRLDDEKIKKNIWSGVLELALKNRRARDFNQFLENLIPMVNEIEIQTGDSYIKIVLAYVLNDISTENKSVFEAQIKKLATPSVEENAMTIAEQYEQDGFERAMAIAKQQKKQIFTNAKAEGKAESQIQIAKTMIKENLPLEMIIKFTQLDKSIIIKLSSQT